MASYTQVEIYFHEGDFYYDPDDQPVLPTLNPPSTTSESQDTVNPTSSPTASSPSGAPSVTLTVFKKHYKYTGGKPVPLEGHPSIDLEKFFNESQIYLELKFLVPIFFISDKHQSCTKKNQFFCLKKRSLFNALKLQKL